MEGSHTYEVDKALLSSPWGWAGGSQILTVKGPACYKMLHRVSDLACSCEHGNEPSGSIKGGKPRMRGKIILELISGKYSGEVWTGFI
jgi:hypothetical protein